MTRTVWTKAQDAILRQRYPHERTADVAAACEHSASSTYQRAYALGLRKSATFLASPAAGRTNGRQGIGTRFQKGAAPWNKGTHFVAGGRSAETRFKPGRHASEARNYLPIGSLRVSKDGYCERKVTDNPALVPARRWVGVHRLVWEAAHGAVPAGYAVAFLPGQFTQDADAITVERLELVSRAELMRRNTVHNLPKPLAQVIQLAGALKRQIRRRDGEEQNRRPA